MKKDDFVHLHTHSDFSQLDGCGKIKNYVETAAKRGSPAISFTDHGTMRGYYKSHIECEKQKIKSIFGIEFYACNDMRRKGISQEEKNEIIKGIENKQERKNAIKEYEEREGIRDRWHLTAWAKNNTGLKNLFYLSSLAYTEGHYYKPRIDLDTLIKHSKGIMIGAGCMNSIIYDLAIRGKKRRAIQEAEKLREAFGERFWLEIQPHKLEGQVVANKFALELKEMFGKKARLLATQDAHYVEQKHHVHHDVLLCIGTNNLIKNPNRFKFDGDEFYFKTRRQMFSTFDQNHNYLGKRNIKDALNNTILFSEMCNASITIDYHAALLPEVEVPNGFDNEWDYFKYLCFDGWKWRKIKERAKKLAKRKNKNKNDLYYEYKKRLIHEMSSIEQQKFVSYFLIVHDIINFARQKRIMVGPGRGSVAGSLVAYLLGITSVDPIEHDLLFERFMNPERCFPGNTLIKTDNGWKKIKDIEPLKDKVKTRNGYNVVLDKPVRETNEELIEIKGIYGDKEVCLTTTKNHVIYLYLNGEIKAQRAEQFEKGQEFIFENSYLHYLQKEIQKNCLEQKNLFQKVFNKENFRKKKNCPNEMSILQEKFYGTNKSKTLFEKMWKACEPRFCKKSSKVWISKRLRTCREIFFGSRFREIIKSSRNRVSIRAKSNPITERNDLYSGFLGRRFQLLYRIKRLEKTERRKNRSCKEFFGKENKNSLLSSGYKFNKKERSFSGREIRTDEQQSIQSFSNSKKDMSGVRERISSSNNKTRTIQSLQQILCECCEIQGIEAEKNKRKRKEIEVAGKKEEKRLNNEKTDERDLSFKNKHRSSKIETVKIINVKIIKSEKPIKVYDLCISKIHEYYANGILVKNSDMPDIDLDFEKERRQEIFDYLRKKYGTDRVAQISNINKLKGKQCIKDVARVFGVPFQEANKITSDIIERKSGDSRADCTVEDSFKEFDSLKGFNKKYPNVLKYASVLEGMAKALSIHAGGIVIAPDSLTKFTPLEIRKYDGADIIVTALDKDGLAAIGLVKLDILGLKTLTVLRECLELIEERHEIKINLEELDLYNDEVLQGFTDHNFSGVFQFDTSGADKLSRGIVFEDFEDLPTINALNRPGATRSGLAKQWVAKKKDPEKRNRIDFHEKVSEITKDSFGVIAYQEHVNRIFIDVAGFNPGRADTLRRKIAKSKGQEVIDAVRKDFIRGAIKNNVKKKIASKLMDAIKFFGDYSFNKSHATAYAIIAYWCMYLKTNYPIEFYCALLNNEEKDSKIQQITKDAKDFGITFSPPDVSTSKNKFTIDPNVDNVIRSSLIDIKSVGNIASNMIIRNQPYKSFWRFKSKVDTGKVNKGILQNLIKAGALDRLLPNRKWSIENIDLLVSCEEKSEIKRLIKKSKKKEDYDENEKLLLSTSVNSINFGKHPLEAYNDFIKENIKVKFAKIDDKFFERYNNLAVFICGMIIDIKLNQIGDFHSGELPNERERERMFWGKRYANVNFETKNGAQERVKFDFDVYNDARLVLEEGKGTPIIFHAIPNKQFKTIRADFVVDLAKLKKKIDKKEKVDNLWERILLGKHPVKKTQWKNDKIKKQRLTNERFYKNNIGGVFCGVVTHVKQKYDKNKNLMAFIGILGVKNHIEVVCFSSGYKKDKKKFVVGNLIEIAIEKQVRGKEISYIYNGGGVKVK